MVNLEAETGSRAGAVNGWENMQFPPDSSEQEKTHESIIARIGRIITEKANEIVNNIRRKYQERIKSTQEAEREYDEKQAVQDLIVQPFYEMQSNSSSEERAEAARELSGEQLDRLKFIDKNLDMLQVCPSTDRRLTLQEAYQLYDDYNEYVATLDEDSRPQSKLGILTEMETMLEGKINDFKTSGDSVALKNERIKYSMVQDLESMTSVAYYYKNIEDVNHFGSRLLLRRYIREKVQKEGYNGTAEMHNQEPPRIGGALGVEATLGVIEVLDSDEPISVLNNELNYDAKGDIDWDAVVRFSPRGRELYKYQGGLRIAESKKKEIENFDGYAKIFETTFKMLESKEPRKKISEFPLEVREDLIREEVLHVIEGYYGLLGNNLDKIMRLKDNTELDFSLQDELNKTGKSRDEYATYLEERNQKIRDTISDFKVGNISSKKRNYLLSCWPSQSDVLAARYKERAKSYSSVSKILKRDFEQIMDMYRRKDDDFVEEVLKAGLDNAPELPRDVSDYLCRNYKYDTVVNAVGVEIGGSLSLKKGRIEKIVSDIKGRIDQLSQEAKTCERIFGDSIGIDLDDNVGLDPGVREIPELEELSVGIGEIAPAKDYIEEKRFLNERVIPSIEAIMRAIDDEISARNDQSTTLKPAA